VAALVVLAAGIVWLIATIGPDPHPAPIRSIAVLPLENLSGDPNQEYFADGMTEALIGDLAKISALRVISRTSVMQFKGNRQAVREIAEQLDVQAVLEGTVMREGNRVRVAVQLIDARSDAHVWAERYDRDLGGVLALQSEVAEAVAKEVRAELTPDQRAGPDVAHVDPLAYDAYVRGLELFASPGNWIEAIAAFEEAVERDPDFALAYSWLAVSRMRVAAAFLLPAAERAGLMPAAVEAAMRALELDERQGLAHSTIGLVRLFQWDFDAAGRSLARAMQLSPSDPRVLSAYNWYLLMMSRRGEAREVAERLRIVAPLDAEYRSNVARSFYFTREYSRALEEMKQALELDEDADPYFLMFIYYALGRVEESHEAQVALSRRYAALGIPGREEIAEAQERGWVEGGIEGEIRAGIRVMAQLAERGLYSPFAIAMLHARLGEIDEAFHWLERAYEKREAILYALNATPDADPLRSDPRFQDLLRRMGFPEV
jgi:TolB-like protein/Tfp pilus assembly protein PilF